MEINPNSPQSNGTTLQNTGLGNVQRPGEYLRQIRVAQKRELADVAEELKIPLKQLTALEQDDYHLLPEATFIKGYYRSYAKLLKADATAIIQRFDEIYANDTGLLPNHALNNSPIKIMGKLSSSERNHKKWLKRAAIAVVALALIWALVSGISNWMNQKDEADAIETAPQSNVEILSVNPQAGQGAGDQLVLEFSRPTSVMITDATGKVLASGRQASNLNLSGESPFQIRLDDAAAVKLSLNNEQIALSTYTVNGKADFRLAR